MPKAADITGQRFGRLIARERVGTKWGKALWSFDCDCGTKDFRTTQNAVSSGKKYANGTRRGHGGTQSCGCWNKECLFFGPNPRRVKRPKFVVPITFPVPERLYPDKSAEFNEYIRRRYQYRWERVEHESRQIEKGKHVEDKDRMPYFAGEGQRKPFVPLDDYGRPIIPLDLRGMMKERQRNYPSTRVSVPDVPASFNTGASLADRVRIVSDEEWARL